MEEFDLPPCRKGTTLHKLNIAWKQRKSGLRCKWYDKFPTDVERKRNVPPLVKKEDWEQFVDMCSTEVEQAKRENGKFSRMKMKNKHTTGRKGSACVIGELKKNSPTGTVTWTEGFLGTYRTKDGGFLPDSLETMEIKRLTSVNPDLVEKDLDNDPVALVCGRDGRGRTRGLGTGVSKTSYHASKPYKEIAQREKKAHETTNANYVTIIERLDEESSARKKLEEEVATMQQESSTRGSSSQMGWAIDMELVSNQMFSQFLACDYAQT
ncbi:hypothetical protein IFM89_038594 [Coptis chinensis]|uniref:Transposase n=1 Tax=Coptis chinensis TaxID=261450 RepID=A0A835LLM8_9MAGN|nr:hypothetical protein IFM89_038594 [Coptis chinensis]